MLETPNLGGDSRSIEFLETVYNIVYINLKTVQFNLPLVTFVLNGQRSLANEGRVHKFAGFQRMHIQSKKVVW